jgi:hypothetical protein
MVDPGTSDDFGLIALWDQSVSSDLLRSIARLIIEERKGAAKYCRDTFPDAEAHDLRGHHARGRIEAGLLGIPAEFSEVAIQAERNKTRNSFHRELMIGRFIVTVSTASWPNQVVGRALFRRVLAYRFQGRLFPDEYAQQLSELQYAVILHGAYGKDQSKTDFVQVGFPNEGFTGYLTKINVLARFPDLTSPAPAPQVTDEPTVKIKPDVQKADDNEGRLA